MKKIISFFIAAFALNVLFADVFMLREGGVLRTQGKKDGLEYATTVSAGTYLESQNIEELHNMITTSSTEKNVPFYKVKYNGKEYYARIAETAPCSGSATMAVIKNDATIFSNPVPSDFQNKYLKIGQLVALSENDVSFEGITFAEIYYWDPAAWTVKKIYVRKQNLSTYINDVKAARFISKAFTFTNSEKDESEKEMKIDFLTKAVESGADNEISEFAIMLRDIEIDSIDSVSYSETNFSAPFKINVPENEYVNIRNYPSTYGKVIGKAKGQTVCGEASYFAEDTECIGKDEDSWYLVNVETEAGPVKGWIFGAGLVQDK